MILQAISWLGFIMGVIGVYLAPRWQHGWFVAGLASIPWVVYSIFTGTYAIMAMSLFYFGIDMINYRKVLNDSKNAGGTERIREA